MKTTFAQEVYELIRSIPKGKISTYKEVAKAIGKPKAVRAVGHVLKANRHPDKTPCYKIVRSDGSLGGYCGSDPKNISRKERLLKRDGIKVVDGKVDLRKYLYRFR